MCEYCDGNCKKLPVESGDGWGFDFNITEDGQGVIDLPSISFNRQSFHPDQILFSFKFCPMCGRDLRGGGRCSR